MKRFILVTIIGFVLTALAVTGGPQPLASPAAVAECDCGNLETLQIELRNALRLQQAFRNKIPELRGMNRPTSQNALQVFAKGEARRGFEPIPDYKGPAEVDYYPVGRGLHADTNLSSRKDDLCRRDATSESALKEAKEKSACVGIGAATQAHEDFHANFCRRVGFVPYEAMHGADRAQEEVEAYGAQIAVLRAEIAKVLEHTNVRIEFESEVRAQWPPNPAITAEIIEVRSDVSMDRVSASGDMIKLEGQGTQTNNARLEGHCSFTGGLPFTLTSRGTLETDGLEAQIRLTTEGTSPSLKAQCTIEGQTGRGWTMPVNLNSGGNVPVINMPLKNRAEKVFDHSTGEGAKIMAQAGVKLSGQAKIRLILCEQSK